MKSSRSPANSYTRRTFARRRELLSADGTDALHGLDDDVRDARGCLVRQEEDRARDGQYICVRARLERCALFLRQPSVAFFGMDDPGGNAGTAESLGATFVAVQPTRVL